MLFAAIDCGEAGKGDFHAQKGESESQRWGEADVFWFLVGREGVGGDWKRTKKDKREGG